MSGAPNVLDMLRHRERMLERELVSARADAAKLIAVADARLTEVRELIERAAKIERTPNA